MKSAESIAELLAEVLQRVDQLTARQEELVRRLDETIRRQDDTYRQLSSVQNNTYQSSVLLAENTRALLRFSQQMQLLPDLLGRLNRLEDGQSTLQP